MQINQRENMNVLSLQASGLVPKWVAHVRQLARRLWSPGRKVFV